MNSRPHALRRPFGRSGVTAFLLATSLVALMLLSGSGSTATATNARYKYQPPLFRPSGFVLSSDHGLLRNSGQLPVTLNVPEHFRLIGTSVKRVRDVLVTVTTEGTTVPATTVWHANFSPGVQTVFTWTETFATARQVGLGIGVRTSKPGVGQASMTIGYHFFSPAP